MPPFFFFLLYLPSAYPHTCEDNSSLCILRQFLEKRSVDLTILHLQVPLSNTPRKTSLNSKGKKTQQCSDKKKGKCTNISFISFYRKNKSIILLRTGPRGEGFLADMPAIFMCLTLIPLARGLH